MRYFSFDPIVCLNPLFSVFLFHRKNQGLLIRRRLIPTARIPVPISMGTFFVGVCAGRAVCMGSCVVVIGREVTGGGFSVVVGGTVIVTGCGVVKISIAAGALLE